MGVGGEGLYKTKVLRFVHAPTLPYPKTIYFKIKD